MGRLAEAGISLLLVACGLFGANGAAADGSSAAFPAGFYFGTSIAGFQVEMGCPSLVRERCEDSQSDWYAFITSPWTLDDPQLYLSQDPPTKGPGFYELYREDLQRAHDQLGGNALRLSLEWSRLFPKSTVGVHGFAALRAAADPVALTYYHDLLAQARAQGFEPFVTLSHYTLPLWIHDGVGCHRDFAHCRPRGWDDEDLMLTEIGKFAAFAAREFGQQVDYWSTINGPFASVVLSGFINPSPTRTNPPGVYNETAAAKRAMRTMVEAHARIYDAIHREDLWSAVPGQPAASVGLSSALILVEPATRSAGDIAAADRMRYLINEVFLNAVVNGDLDEGWDHHPVHRADLAGRMDYLGINYYFRWPVSAATVPPLFAAAGGAASTAFPGLPTRVALGASIDNAADGLYDIIEQTAAYRLPIFVTETGYDAAADAGLASRWLERTLAATHKAIAAGYPVRGYFYWSLLDNYEWNEGARVRFGLFSVDPDDQTKQRVARPAAASFHRISQAWAFP